MFIFNSYKNLREPCTYAMSLPIIINYYRSEIKRNYLLNSNKEMSIQIEKRTFRRLIIIGL